MLIISSPYFQTPAGEEAICYPPLIAETNSQINQPRYKLLNPLYSATTTTTGAAPVNDADSEPVIPQLIRKKMFLVDAKGKRFNYPLILGQHNRNLPDPLK